MPYRVVLSPSYKLVYKILKTHLEDAVLPKMWGPQKLCLLVYDLI